MQQIEDKNKGLRPFLQLSGRAAAGDASHQQPQIESCRMDQQPFQNVWMSPQMRSSHRSGFVHMSEAPFYLLATLSQ